MFAAERLRERVEERLVALDEAYGPFPVNQVTLSVQTDVYERTRDRCQQGLVDAYVQVYDGEDVLLVDRSGDWVVPHVVPHTSERIQSGTERAVRERTGVACSITDLDRVTILGVRDESVPDPTPIYRLITLFVADADDGSPDDDAAWRADLPDSALPLR